MDWFAEVDRFFDYLEILEERKVILVAYRLKGAVSDWWNVYKTQDEVKGRDESENGTG